MRKANRKADSTKFGVSIDKVDNKSAKNLFGPKKLYRTNNFWNRFSYCQR